MRARQAGAPIAGGQDLSKYARPSRKKIAKVSEVGNPLVDPKKLRELLEARCEHGNSSAETCEKCWRTKPMSFWEGVLHRSGIEDGRQIILIHARLRVLETPWYKPLQRRDWRRALADDRKAYVAEKTRERMNG